ncbi:MAG: hypothetical protein H9W81_06065 [Enterococcus sp.]|nr:hypothetical protein [Enterococcus sp.]
MTKTDIKDASLATVILGATILFGGMMAASAATPVEDPAPTYSVQIPQSVNSSGGADLTFESHGGASLAK